MTMKKLSMACVFAACSIATITAHAAPTEACSANIEGRPGKQFSLTHITVPAQCEQFSVRLIHVGKKPKEQAGHNWVLTKTAEIDAVTADGLQAGAQHDFVVPNDARILAKTPMLGGGETAVVTFPVSRLRQGQSYTYYCSFPSHAAMMRGTLSLGQ